MLNTKKQTFCTRAYTFYWSIKTPCTLKE